MSKHICNICNGRLPDYVEGKLDVQQARTLRAHLAASPECAGEEARLRALFETILSRNDDDVSLPDPGAFLAEVNAGIDRRRQASHLPWLPRPALAIPALAAMLLVVSGILYFGTPQGSADGDPLFPDLLAGADVGSIDPGTDLTPLLRDVTVAELETEAETGISEEVPEETYPELGTQIDLTLLEDVPYSSVVDASLDYITPYDAVETLDASAFDDIVTTLENNRYTFL